MGLQRYRADVAGKKQANGGTPWYADWIGGPTLAFIRDCPISNAPLGLTSELSRPRTVYTTGEPDACFGIPAACRYRVVKGKQLVLRGWITTDEAGEFYFRAYNRHNGKEG